MRSQDLQARCHPLTDPEVIRVQTDLRSPMEPKVAVILSGAKDLQCRSEAN